MLNPLPMTAFLLLATQSAVSATPGTDANPEAAIASRGDPGRHQHAVATRCPLIRSPLGAQLAVYVIDYYPSGADACVVSTTPAGSTEVVPHNFCPLQGRYTPRLNAIDVCAPTVSAPIR